MMVWSGLMRVSFLFLSTLSVFLRWTGAQGKFLPGSLTMANGGLSNCFSALLYFALHVFFILIIVFVLHRRNAQ